MWNCANCGERIEEDFEICWNCQTEKGASSTLPKVEDGGQDWECLGCGADVGAQDNICPKCGADISEVSDSVEEENAGSGNLVIQKYPALRVISVVLKVLATIAAFAGLVGALVGLAQMSGTTYGAPATGGVIVLVSLVYGGLGCLYSLAISEGIRVFIDVEENTRMTNALLRKLLDR